MADVGGHTAPLSQALLGTMADTADQFLAAAYDVLMSNVRKVRSSKNQLQLTVSSVLVDTDFTKDRHHLQQRITLSPRARQVSRVAFLLRLGFDMVI
jgi:hypothetical protein